jgi:hypothetical protein
VTTVEVPPEVIYKKDIERKLLEEDSTEEEEFTYPKRY